MRSALYLFLPLQSTNITKCLEFIRKSFILSTKYLKNLEINFIKFGAEIHPCFIFEKYANAVLQSEPKTEQLLLLNKLYVNKAFQSDLSVTHVVFYKHIILWTVITYYVGEIFYTRHHT